MRGPSTKPLSTYRVQFNERFRFTDARAIVPYLHDLGVTDLYASPIVAARRGSSHGYDVTYPTRLNPALGSAADFDALVGELEKRHMGLIVDIVPNHQAASTQNPWWNDVLENGPDSRHAHFFDIDWHRYRGTRLGQPQVMLPVLGDSPDRVLEKAGLRLCWSSGALVLDCGDLRFPVAAHSYPRVLRCCVDRLKKHLGSDHPFLACVGRIADSDGQLPTEPMQASATGPGEPLPFVTVRQELRRLDQADPEIAKALGSALSFLNGRKGDPRRFDFLRCLLDEQYYRLAPWRSASSGVNYKRFFHINDLVRVRVEDARVFDATHGLIFALAHRGRITGLRIDHVDGLHDPAAYLHELRSRLSSQVPAGRHLVIYVEKILQARESLPVDWPVEGTTGYEFIRAVNAVFVDPRGLAELDRVYSRFVGAQTDFQRTCDAAKKRVLEELFVADVGSLTRMLRGLVGAELAATGVDEAALRQALEDVSAHLPVYRTYIRGIPVRNEDRAFIEQAVTLARSGIPETGVGRAALEILRRVLLLETFRQDQAARAAHLEFVMRWQQLTGPVMAKGLEDMALYTYNRLLSLNEVGGDPAGSTAWTDAGAFHRFNRARRDRWPGTLNTTATHDTKRGEDVRARLNVLSEIPARWSARLDQWSGWNHSCKRKVNGRVVPDDNDEYFLYQTLIGAWPLENDQVPVFRERLSAYLVKAAREAGTHTSWLEPDQSYESALLSFAAEILEPSCENPFLGDMIGFQNEVAYYGALNGLSQVVLKVASPGVPDFYQGSELWDLNLVDPDNRRPVDFGMRARALRDLNQQRSRGGAPLIRDLVARWSDGHIKLYVTQRALRFRTDHAALFLEGAYIPLAARGERSGHVCAFARELGGAWAIAVVPRRVVGLTRPGQPPIGRGVWQSTCLELPAQAPRQWFNELTDEAVEAAPTESGSPVLELAQVCRALPVALLRAVPDRS